MSLPLNNSPINSENTKFVEFLLPGSRYSDPVLFLPYVPGCINACVFNGRQDIVSAPFSGCHLVLFQYKKECFMEAIYGMGKSKIFCTYNKFGCVKTCPYHATFVAHVAYDSYGSGTNSSKNIWETLKNDSNLSNGILSTLSYKSICSASSTTYNSLGSEALLNASSLKNLE